jgi:putative SOS response-associated peptidase YedK
MCSNYIPSARDHIASLPGLAPVALPEVELAWPAETYPGYAAPIVVAAPQGGHAAQCVVARFGLVPRWCRDERQATTVSRGTYNARSETVASKPSFRAAWTERRFALAPMQAFFEPCWEQAHLHGNRPTRWRFAQADSAPFAAAALHEHWTDPDTGERVQSFSLLTVNAEGHPLLGRMHRPGDEKRMLVIVPPMHHSAWLNATLAQAQTFMRTTPAEQLTGAPADVPRVQQQAWDF